MHCIHVYISLYHLQASTQIVSFHDILKNCSSYSTQCFWCKFHLQTRFAGTDNHFIQTFRADSSMNVGYFLFIPTAEQPRGHILFPSLNLLMAAYRVFSPLPLLPLFSNQVQAPLAIKKQIILSRSAFVTSVL